MRHARRVGATLSAVTVGVLASMAGVAAAEPVQGPQRAQLRHFSFFRTAPEGLPGWGQKIEEAERAEEAIKHGMQTGGFRAGFGIVPDGAIAAKLSPTLTVPVVRGTFFMVRYRGLDVSKLWTKAKLVFGASTGNG
jgi:hypothetical protein